MPTVALSPDPILRFVDNAGNPLVGGLLTTTVGGVPFPTYIDENGTIPNTNPIVLNSRGEVASTSGQSCPLYLQAGITYSFSLTDATGTPIYSPEDIQGIPTNASITALISQTYIGATLWPQSLGENNAGVVPLYLQYYYGDIRRYGAIADSGTTDNTGAVQQAINANAGYYKVFVPAAAGAYWGVTGRITAPANTHIVMETGSILRWRATTATGTNWLGSASSPGLEVTGDGFALEGDGTLYGPSTNIYVLNEFCLLRIGTSAASRGTGFVVKDVEITNWGSHGIGLQYVQDILIENCTIHNNGYVGVMPMSCQNGRIQRNRIYSMTPGTPTSPPNMYGISCNHNSAGYNTDPNVTAAPRQTANPFCIDMEAAGNEVYGINWIGVDAHGGYEVNFHDNKVYDCYIGIQLASGSNAAGPYAGENNKVCHNTIYASQINGAATTTTGHSGLQFGITVNGGSILANRGVEVIGNTIVGCGDTSGVGGSAYSIQCSNMQDAVIVGNSIRNWSSVGIYGNNFDGTISNNVLNQPANASLTKCIWLDSGSARTTINGNRFENHGGNNAAEGIRISSSSSTRPVVGSNEMTQATTPYSGNAATFTAGLSDVPPRIQDSTSGSHTADLSSIGFAPVVYYQYTSGSTGTITSMTGLSPGQIVVIYTSGAGTLTVNDTGSTIKLTGGTAAVAQFGTLTLMCVATTGNPQFVEIGRSLSNT
jgi:parallel beta-helix repeat protein